MSGAGFVGRWRALTENHRLPSEVARFARRFAATQLGAESELLPRDEQLELPTGDECRLRWVQTEPGLMADVCLEEVDLIMARSRHGTGETTASWTDMFLIFDSGDVGRDVVELLVARDIEVHNTFGRERDGRMQKRHFYKGDGRVKATTIQSFKGWEARQLVVAVSSSGLDARKRLYSGLTRVKRSDRGSFLTIVCTDPGLRDVGLELEFAERSIGDG
jgi:hypothetical protein